MARAVLQTLTADVLNGSRSSARNSMQADGHVNRKGADRHVESVVEGGNINTGDASVCMVIGREFVDELRSTGVITTASLTRRGRLGCIPG